MKKVLFLFFALTLPVIVNAEKVQIDGVWYELIAKVACAEVTFADDESKYIGEVIIPESVEYNGICYKVTNIGEKAFASCYDLTKISIPNTVTDIESQAFYACSGITEIILPNSVTQIGALAFAYCNSLIGVEMPSSVTSISGAMFSDCTKLVSVTIPDQVTEIKYNAFAGCENLVEINIPNAVKCIEHGAFSGCMNLKNITLPNSINSIDNGTFSGCSSLTQIVIPSSVTIIHDYAFQKCSNLTEVTIGKSVKAIGNKSFAGCSNLSNIYCYAQDIPNVDENTFTDSYIEYATLHVPDSSYYDYKEADVWKDFGTINTLSGNIPAYIHNLIYMVDGIEYKKYEVPYGEAIAIEEEPIKEGYTFSGWSEIPTTMPAYDVTVKGVFDVNTYQVTYMLDGEIFQIDSLAYGTPIIKPESPAKEDYEFDGWSETPETMPASDLTVIGTYTQLAHCDTPTISYKDGKLMYECTTEGATCVTNIVSPDFEEHTGDEVELTLTYQVNVYAKAEGYAKSPISTATICWIECNHENETNGVEIIPAIVALIKASDGIITIEGLGTGMPVAVYTTSGAEVANGVAEEGVTLILNTRMQKGDVAIVKISSQRMKVLMK